MVDRAREESAWLQYRSQVTGKSVEELRQIMRERGEKADKSKAGFASFSKEKRDAAIKKSIETRQSKKEQQ